MTIPHAQPADWYPDPAGGRFLRYWNGTAWTEHTRPLQNAQQSARPAGAAAGSAVPPIPPAPPLFPASSAPAAPGASALPPAPALAPAPPASAVPPASATPPASSAPPVPQAPPGPAIPAAPVTMPPSAIQPYRPPAPGHVPAMPGGAPVGHPAAAPAYAGQYPGAPAPVGVWRGPIDTRPAVRTLGDAVKVCVQKYAQFDGRASRPEYWYAQLTYLLAIIAALFVIWIPILGFVVVFALWAFMLASIVPLLAVTVRRLRDAGFAWPWIFIAFAPFGGIVLLILCAQPSKHP